MAMSTEPDKEVNESLFIQVINLDRSKDRWTAISKDLRALNLNFTRLSACDGKTLGFKSFQHHYDLKKWSRFHHRNPILSELGCYASHIKAIEEFLAQDKPYTLILEDDAVCGGELIGALSFASGHADQWDVLMLHASHPGYQIKVAREEERHLCAFLGRASRATAYLLNKDAAQRILDIAYPAYRPYDWMYNQSHKLKLKVRLLKPYPVSPREVKSVIEAERDHTERSHFLGRHSDKPLLPRWRLPFTRMSDNIRRVFYVLLRDELGKGGLPRK